nr:hypothetical protein [uncultured bacterium]
MADAAHVEVAIVERHFLSLKSQGLPRRGLAWEKYVAIIDRVAEKEEKTEPDENQEKHAEPK